MKDIKILLGKRIKELRKSLGISQQELSELIEVDQRNLSNIECGVSFPTKTLLDIAQALKVSLPELFNFEHHKFTLEEMKNHIQEEINNLSEENIKIIYKLIKSMR